MSMFRITVQPWMIALEHRQGKPTRALGPGRHRRYLRATYAWVDTRERMSTTAPQEVLTADGVSVKVTAVVRWRAGDAVMFTEASQDPEAVVYLAVQLALREVLAGLEADSLVRSARAEVGRVASQAAEAAGREVGIEVAEVVVKDVVLPAELRSAYAAVVTGRQLALAQLEAARAETAALRSLANGAKVLEDHPALARQRLVLALPPGAQVKLK